jgi:hypothetical protein
MAFAIPVKPSSFLTYYPLVTSTVVGTPPKTKVAVSLKDPGGSLQGELNNWVSELKNENPNYTTCCIQMSHAINMAFHMADPSKMVGARSVRRKTRAFKIAAAANKEFHYLASVDEMKAFLDSTFDEGEEISRRADGKPASPQEAKSFVQDRPGIVVFMKHQAWGFHTEVWTGSDWHQNWMKGRMGPFGWAPVWFWDMGVPTVPIV